MTNEELVNMMIKKGKDIIKDFETYSSKRELIDIISETISLVVDNKAEKTLEIIIDEYIDSVKAIAKLSPALATGLKDIKKGIIINTYIGKTSDKEDAKTINSNTPFDIASITKFIISILLLKEEENGNIDLNKPFSYYTKQLKKINVPIYDALRFGIEIRTSGRLDEEITKEERIKRFKEVYIHKKDTFIYSDIPYMIVLLLFGKTEEEANINFIRKIYNMFDEMNLHNTRYFIDNKTGGIVNIKDKTLTYDPKARTFEFEDGYILGHAGLTSTVEDLQKIFESLYNGFLAEKSLEKLITPVIKDTKILLDDKGKPVIRKGKQVNINRGMGVYINLGDLRKSDISKYYSKKAFATEGSTGTYSVFDLKNGFNATFFSNIKSTTKQKIINTENYLYGDIDDSLPKNFETAVIAGTKTEKDGRIYREDGTEMIYARATNNFKDEQFKTIFKLRFMKELLKEKIICEEKDINLRNKKLNELNKKFVRNIYMNE